MTWRLIVFILIIAFLIYFFANQKKFHSTSSKGGHGGGSHGGGGHGGGHGGGGKKGGH